MVYLFPGRGLLDQYITELQEAASKKQKSIVDEKVNKMIGSEGIEIRSRK